MKILHLFEKDKTMQKEAKLHGITSKFSYFGTFQALERIAISADGMVNCLLVEHFA